MATVPQGADEPDAEATMAQTAFILIVSDDARRGPRLRDQLRSRWKHSCHVVTSSDEALESIRTRVPDVVVLADGSAGREAVRSIGRLLAQTGADSALVVLASDGQKLPAPAGVAQFVTLPERLSDDELLVRINDVAREAVARYESRLQKQLLARRDIQPYAGRLVGVSPAMRRIIERIRKAARNKLTVLIIGETGTGKELIARAIHNESDRARKPFCSLNCAGLSETLIESELFGHVKGSFTGAIADRKGYFAAADGGTLFLDEIGDMPLRMQAKLLRVLELREFTPVGSTEVQRVDVRVIAATNADLKKKIEEKQFREDLYYRLHQWVIHVPPLRERREDIPILAHYLLKQANYEHGLNVEGFTSAAMNVLTRYYWPGNVRELKNVIESTACEVGQGLIDEKDLPDDIRGTRELAPVSASGLVGLTLEQVERLMIERTLQATGGNREQAARMLDIGTRTLYRKIKEYGLS